MGRDSSNKSDEKPIGDVLPNARIRALPDKWTPIDVVAIVKCLDENGEVSYAVRRGDAMTDEELLGSLISLADKLRDQMLSEWDEDDGDEDE